MKWISFLSIIILCGCSGGKSSNKAGDVKKTADVKAKSGSPLVIEARITGGGDGSKYHWYTIKTIAITTNTIGAKADALTRVAIPNGMPKVEVGKTYILDMNLYNPSKPEIGFKVTSLKLKP